MLTNIIPAPWRILFIVLAMAAAAALGWQEGAMHARSLATRSSGSPFISGVDAKVCRVW